MSVINSLSDITENGLCIGCGICQSIAGNENISISMTEKGRLEPKENKPLNSEIFDKIKKTCPGIIVEGLPKEAIDNGSNFLVIGRPITSARNIQATLLEIHNSI